MAYVHSSRESGYELASLGDENPTEYLESEGERLIKQMVQKQLNKQVSLKEQLQEGKAFEACAEFVPITRLTSGQISYSDFKDLAEKVSHIEDLKSSGLTEKEIEFLSDYERGERFFEEKYKKVEISAVRMILEEIQKKIHRKATEELDEKRNERVIGRHELELGLCVKPQSDHTKLLQFALSCKMAPSSVVDPRPPSHPINNLKEIEAKLFGHLMASPTSVGGRRSRKKRRRREEHLDEDILPVAIDKGSSSSSWDKKTVPLPRKRLAVEVAAKVYDCAPKRKFTIRDGKIMPLDDGGCGTADIPKKGVDRPSPSVEGLPFVFTDACKGSTSTSSVGSSLQLLTLQEIFVGRIKEEEMSTHPHFKNYSRGEPSRVLYVKNISPSVKEEDLVCLFGNFEIPGESKITYRLMSGRMKGQAFITFPTVQSASTALEAVNGYNCKGKPLVVLFGKSKM